MEEFDASESFFSAPRMLRHFEAALGYFCQHPYEDACAIFDDIYRRENQLERQAARLAKTEAALKAHLSTIFALAGHEGLARRIAHEGPRHYLVGMAKILVSLSRPDFWSRVVEVEGAPALEELLARHGSCVFVLAHMGPHLALPFVLFKMGLTFGHSGGGADDVQSWYTDIARFHRLDMTAVGMSINDDFKTRALRFLHEGASLIIYPEYSRSSRRGQTLVDFLDTKVHAPTGAARLASVAGKPLVFVSLTPIGEDRFRLRFGPQWDAPSDEEGIRQVTLASFAEVERAVLADPVAWEGWNYFHLMKNAAFEIMLQGMAESA